jgi:hypothetical protein
MATIFKNVKILGDLTVAGTTSSKNTEVSNITDSYLYLNNGSTDTSQPGGEVVNVASAIKYQSSTDKPCTITTTTIKLYTDTIASTPIFAVDQFIQLSKAISAENNGLYRIMLIDDTTDLIYTYITISSINSIDAPDIYKTNLIPTNSDTYVNICIVTVSVLKHKIESDNSVSVYLGSGDNTVALNESFKKISTGGNDDAYVFKDGKPTGQVVIGQSGTLNDNGLTLQGSFDKVGLIKLLSDVTVSGSIDVDISSSVKTITVGAVNASLINLGRTASTVPAVLGTTTTVLGTLQTADMLGASINRINNSGIIIGGLYSADPIQTIVSFANSNIILDSKSTLISTRPITFKPLAFADMATQQPSSTADLYGLTYLIPPPIDPLGIIKFDYNLPLISSTDINLYEGFIMRFLNTGSDISNIVFQNLQSLEGVTSISLDVGDRVSIMFCNEGWTIV